MFKFPDHYKDPLNNVLMAVFAGFAIAWIYSISAGRGRKNNQGLPATVVLLAALIAVVTQVIGESTARAFGLVGALSIVRFRAVVEDTVDTAFVLFAVIIGMGMGAGQWELSLVAIPLIGFTAWIMSIFSPSNSSKPYELHIRLALGLDPETLLKRVLDDYLLERTLKKVETALKGNCVELEYVVKPRPNFPAYTIISDISKIEGVQGVEWKAGSN